MGQLALLKDLNLSDLSMADLGSSPSSGMLNYENYL